MFKDFYDLVKRGNVTTRKVPIVGLTPTLIAVRNPRRIELSVWSQNGVDLNVTFGDSNAQDLSTRYSMFAMCVEFNIFQHGVKVQSDMWVFSGADDTYTVVESLLPE